VEFLKKIIKISDECFICYVLCALALFSLCVKNEFLKFGQAMIRSFSIFLKK